MRVIITGGSGLIGQALMDTLLAGGHEVIVLSRNPSKVRDLPSGARAERWDGKTPNGWGELVSGAAIVNLAGENISEGRWTAERKERILESRLSAGEAVVKAANEAETRPALVVQASSVGYYGLHADEELDETSPPGSDFLARVCVAWEASTEAVEALGVRRVIIRTAPVLSQGKGVLEKYMLPFRYFIGGRIGSGRQWLSWVHIADEVAAIRFLIDHEASRGVFNLCSPQPLTNAQFSSALGKAMHRPSLVPAPAFAVRLLFGEVSMVVLGGQRVLPRRLLESGFVFGFANIESALQDLIGSA